MAPDVKSIYYDTLFCDQKDKAEAFDILANQFYTGRFGAMAKSDIEVLLFHLYLEQCFKKGHPCDDYTLSRELGIPQSRIRSLKVKKQLQYPRAEFDWKELFIECIPRARYDNVGKMVKLHVSDVVVLEELRHYIEKQGWYDEYQLNPKLFQCKADIFIKLCMDLEGNESVILDDAAKEALEKLKKSAKEDEKSAIGKILSGAFEDGISNVVKCASKELLVTVLQAIPFAGLAGKAIQALVGVIQKT